MNKKLFPYYHSFMKAIGLQDKIYKTPTCINHIMDNVYIGDFRAADNLPLLPFYFYFPIYYIRYLFQINS